MRALEKAIHDAATVKIQGFERYLKKVQDENRRRSRRSSGKPGLITASRPAMWMLDPAFDPYHVRSRADSISHAIERKVNNGSYEPLQPGGFHVDKADGSQRLVAAFAIADEVVSRRLYRSLLNKNRSRLSARSYAYRNDLGVHDALAHMHSEWATERRLFVAQYDFTDFFGSIMHDHLWRSIDAIGLVSTRLERRLIHRFLTAAHPSMNVRERALPPDARTRGVHQGTSVSLLLANIAAAPLDRELERLGVSFVRYADDLIIWSREYDSITRAVDQLHRFADNAGCEINEGKSPGIQLLVSEGTQNAEMRHEFAIDYLSHRIGLGSVSIQGRALDGLQNQITAQLFNHLIREPLRGSQDSGRLRGGLDRDYVAYIWQLRRFLYGNLSEEQVRRHLSRSIPSGLRLSGALARFPLITNTDQLQELDSWIATQTWLALRRRSQLLGPTTFMTPDPWSLSRDDLIRFRASSTRTGAGVDARLPSATRMMELIHRTVRAHGTRAVGSTSSAYGP